MTKLLNSAVAVCMLCLPLAMCGQADAPASVTNIMPTGDFGFNLPSRLGTLSYSLSGSEMLETGYGNGVDTSTALSGNLAYLSTSERAPFSFVYSGGYLFTTVPGSNASSTFQDLAASQVLHTQNWVFVVSDSASFLPGAPTTGLSGVAGVGDVGVLPVQNGLGPAEDILTNYSNRIGNGLSGSASWQLGPSLDLEGSASWQILHFTGAGNSGLDSSSYSASVGPNYRIDVRNSVGATAYYQYATFPGYANYRIESEGINLNYSRSWSRRFSTTFSFGPQITRGETTTNIPSGVNFAGSATASYATRTTGIQASYSRGVNAGSGVIFGAMSDTVAVGVSRPVNRDWQLGVNGSYSRNVGLTPYLGVVPRYNAVFGAAQVSRRLTESLSCYGSYTVIRQSSENNVGFNAFNGTTNVIGFGITFAPAPLIRGR